MGKTRGQLKADIQGNLTDLNLNYYSDSDINESMQDAYDDSVAITQCIQSSATCNWISGLSYYDPISDLNITDYLGVIGIFNNVTNLWLRDDLNLKDFDRIRRDWEMWVGAPQFWAPSDPRHFAIAAKYNGSNLGTFKLYYWAQAPLLTSDSDTILIASDMQQVVSQYPTGDLLEQAQEFQKAKSYFDSYYENLESYADRVKRNAKSDLLLRI